MKSVRVLAFVLIITGGFGLAYGGFSYTKNTQQAKLGPLELSLKETETFAVPVWVSIGLVVGGVFLLFVRK